MLSAKGNDSVKIVDYGFYAIHATAVKGKIKAELGIADAEDYIQLMCQHSEKVPSWITR